MYDFWRSVFDDVLMDPRIAPFVVSILVVVIAMSLASVIGDGTGGAEEDSE